MYSHAGDSHSRLSGYPIRRSRDRGLLAAPPGLSQLSASFFAWQLLGIHSWTHIHLTILFLTLPTLIIQKNMGPTRVELVTSSLSEKRSNQLSYDPNFVMLLRDIREEKNFQEAFELFL